MLSHVLAGRGDPGTRAWSWLAEALDVSASVEKLAHSHGVLSPEKIFPAIRGFALHLGSRLVDRDIVPATAALAAQLSGVWCKGIALRDPGWKKLEDYNSERRTTQLIQNSVPVIRTCDKQTGFALSSFWASLSKSSCFFSFLFLRNADDFFLCLLARCPSCLGPSKVKFTGGFADSNQPLTMPPPQIGRPHRAHCVIRVPSRLLCGIRALLSHTQFLYLGNCTDGSDAETEGVRPVCIEWFTLSLPLPCASHKRDCWRQICKIAMLLHSCCRILA